MNLIKRTSNGFKQWNPYTSMIKKNIKKFRCCPLFERPEYIYIV